MGRRFLSAAIFLWMMAFQAHGEIYLSYETTFWNSNASKQYHGIVRACDSVSECENKCKQDAEQATNLLVEFPEYINRFCRFNSAYGVYPPYIGAGANLVNYIHDFTYVICSSLGAGLRMIPPNPWPAMFLGCAPVVDVKKAERKPKADMCSGNPIYVLTGTKREVIGTSFSAGGVELTFTYDTVKKMVSVAEETNILYGVAQQSIYGGRQHGELAALGPLWRSNLHRKLDISPSSQSIVAYRGDGNVVAFSPVTGGYTSDSDVNDTLQVVSGGGYIYTDVTGGVVESYSAAGMLTSLAKTNGETLLFTYSTGPSAQAPEAGYLLQVSDGKGKAINFTYLLPSGGLVALDGRISTVSDSNSRVIQLSYASNGNLSSIMWPDGTTRQLVYENGVHPWGLTGVVDELGQRYSTFTYDGSGRAIATELAGGVNKYSVTYGTPPAVSVVETLSSSPQQIVRTYSWNAPAGITLTTPNGSSILATVNSSQGYPQLAGLSQPAGSGCAASNNASTFDANGNILSQDNFQGQRSCFAYDASNREVVRVEGLANTVACSTVTSAGAVLPSGSRKVTTTWHPDWRLPAQVSEPLLVTTSVYHGQPDPFNGNAIASCTSTAALPNGKPTPLLCKQVKQALLDGGGVDTSAPASVSSYTYDSLGSMLTKTDPLGRVTSYAYYASTSFTGVDPNAVGYTLGDLQSTTNPAGQVTQYPLYDKSGRVKQMIDPKGVVTDIGYTPRGWVSTVTTTAPGGTPRATTYTYDGVGQLTGVSQPDGSTLSYSYDAAHRLVGVTDAKGNSVTYTLDNAGNRVAEETKDSTGALQRSIGRSFDALNRVQQVTGASR